MVSPKDAEAALRIEISENEQRKNFTYSERMGLDFGLDWKTLEYDTQIAINIKRCYDRFTKYRRDCAISGECLEYRQFTKQLRGSDLFLDYKPVGFENGLARAFVLDYTALRARCDIDNFEHSKIPSLR